MKKYVVLAVLAALAVLVGLVMAMSISSDAPTAPRDDVCRELKEVSFWIDQTAKHNHQLRVRMPELRNDPNSNGATHSMISVYSHLYALKDKLGCR